VYSITSPFFKEAIVRRSTEPWWTSKNLELKIVKAKMFSIAMVTLLKVPWTPRGKFGNTASHQAVPA
jgi:hypothetical protein